MKHGHHVGVRVGLPAFFALEVEDVYKHTPGAHRALAFPDFLGFLVGLGLESYRKQHLREEAPDIGGGPEGEPEEEGGEAALHLFDINPAGLPDLFREFNEVMKPPEEKPGLCLVHAGKRPS
jgi:hypothetical protein